MASVISAGTTSTTALNLSGDTTGILQLQTNGTTAAMTINTSQNVGIGTTSPSYNLHVSNANNPVIAVTDTTNPTTGYFQAIDSRVNLGTLTNHPLAFATNDAERMRIDSSGNVLIGTTSGTRKLTVYENAIQVDISIVSSTTGLAILQMGDTTADNQGQIVYRNSSDQMEFNTNGASSLILNSSNNAQFTKNISVGNVTPTTSGFGITFPATQSASTNANTLDDYEEGTWTPIAARYTGGNITAVYGVSNAGKYTKIGRIVILECYLDITSVSSQGSSLSQVTGLPFTPSGSYAATGATFFNTAATTLNIVSCAANQGDNCIYFHESGNSGTLADFAWKAGAMTFTVIYTT